MLILVKCVLCATVVGKVPIKLYFEFKIQVLSNGHMVGKLF